MKAREMTNEELACFFDELASFNREDDKFRETAERLRNQCITIPAQRAKGAVEGYAHGCEKAADLHRRLIVAKDALVKFQTICEQIEYTHGLSICDDALAVICAEGTTN